MQGNRAKPSKHGEGKHLASVNFPLELLEFLNELSEETGLNRSSLVCLIIKDFKDSGKKVKFVVE